jgi:hypothetical protein
MVESVSGEVIATASLEAPAAPEAPITPEVKPQEDEFSDKFIKLTRQKRALEQQASEIKAERARIDAERKELEDFRSTKARIKDNPRTALETLGVSFDDLAHMILTEGREPTSDDKLSALEARLKAFEEAKEKEKQDALDAQRQKTASVFRQNLEKFIDSSDYELVKTYNAADTVEATMQEWYEETEKRDGKGVILSYEDACKMVEEDLEQALEKALQTNKAKTKFGSITPKSESQAEVTQPRAVAPSQTLTNAMRASTEPATPQHRRPTEEERFRSAASLIKFNN